MDNGSDKEPVAVLKFLNDKLNVDIIYNDENLGIATALNIGIKYAEKSNCKWILTMDNDSI